MKRNMKLLISLLLLITVMPACIYDEEPQDIDLTDGIRMGFTIRTAGDTSTRVGNADPETGSELENKIDIENRDFRVYFYHTDDNNNSFIGELEVMMVNRLDENGNYHVVGKIAGEGMESLPENFRVVVMANLEKWGEYPQKPTYGTNSEAYFYSYSGNGYCVSEDKLIPMWGCHTYNNVTSQKGVVTQLTEPIDMLRAFAKIEVINETTDADSDLQLTEVSLTGHSNQFYIQPAASGYTGGNTNAGFTDCNVPNESSKLQTPLNFTEEKEEEISTEGTDTKKTFVLYVPEYTTTDSSSPMTLTVTFSNGVERNIELSKDSPNINTLLRNHIYRFKVSLKKGTLNIWYQGIPWEKKDEISIESGCDYDYNQSTNN